jgi:hypothetical protein
LLRAGRGIKSICLTPIGQFPVGLKAAQIWQRRIQLRSKLRCLVLAALVYGYDLVPERLRAWLVGTLLAVLSPVLKTALRSPRFGMASDL